MADIELDAGVDPAFREDVLAGLAMRPRAIPARWFYDLRGSELFEQITDLPEYYPTRLERSILEANGGAIGEVIGSGHAVVEFGSGSSAKTPLLLDAIAPAAYVPIDISGEFLRESARALSADFPDLPVHPVEADFTHPVPLPGSIADMPKLGFFPGSTIGNFIPPSAVDFLRAMKETLGTGAMLLIGMDRVKGEDVLVPAYDDAAGVTAAFNLNLLERINRELAGDIPVDAFRHRAIWNDMLARIEMHIEAVRAVRFSVAGQSFEMAEGDTIHTENSHKYGERDARILLRAGGWTVVREWTDEADQFALILAEAQPEKSAP
ncbi:L-histidine N(alpha)-methyltransferase [Parasphingopyxis algicola]|uniref:L-histidine N(alpha)-methyltransferase n=1 Tax=Parasphingopyxis algicola TaxID=2026624 RepID=UPI0015A47DE6|nr:L-histidine N(alpha)-methyltransferase [Parasphingopyxis algicola]QLC25537.1 L-histidine N(alpha)-methyltransferase [Parasphingopyxis algicola]